MRAPCRSEVRRGRRPAGPDPLSAFRGARRAERAIIARLGGAPSRPGRGAVPGGHPLLVSASRDHSWRDAGRFFPVGVDERTAEVPLFDSAGKDVALSPDGKRPLFTREGAPWWRKGYRGSQDGQVRMADLGSKASTKQANPPGGALWPLWRADGKGSITWASTKGP